GDRQRADRDGHARADGPRAPADGQCRGAGRAHRVLPGADGAPRRRRGRTGGTRGRCAHGGGRLTARRTFPTLAEFCGRWARVDGVRRFARSVFVETRGRPACYAFLLAVRASRSLMRLVFDSESVTGRVRLRVG